MKLFRKFFAPENPPAKPPARNEHCWCGSGKKYKHCHYEKDQKYYAIQRARQCRGFT